MWQYQNIRGKQLTAEMSWFAEMMAIMKNCMMFTATLNVDASLDAKITSLCPATYVRWQRGTARIRTPLLQHSIDSSCPPGPQRQTHSSGFAAVGLCWDRRTNRRTPYGFIDPAPRTMRAVPVTQGNSLTTVSNLTILGLLSFCCMAN